MARDMKQDLATGFDIHGPVDIAKRYDCPAVVLHKKGDSWLIAVYYQEDGEWKSRSLRPNSEPYDSHGMSTLGIGWARDHLGVTESWAATVFRTSYVPKPAYEWLVEELRAWRAALPEEQERAEERQRKDEQRRKDIQAVQSLSGRLRALGVPGGVRLESGRRLSLTLDGLLHLLSLAERDARP